MNRASFLARLGGGALAAMLPKAVGALETEVVESGTIGTITSGLIRDHGIDYIDLDGKGEDPFIVSGGVVVRANGSIVWSGIAAKRTHVHKLSELTA